MMHEAMNQQFYNELFHGLVAIAQNDYHKILYFNLIQFFSKIIIDVQHETIMGRECSCRLVLQ